eukprot:scaffold5318_cov73-Cyclotella_meneghiniana.AAC.15
MVTSVNGVILQRDKHVRSGCCTFQVSPHGDIIGYKHPRGFLLPAIEDFQQEGLHFFTCPNQTKTPKWAIGFASIGTSFTEMDIGILTDIKFIIVRGIASFKDKLHLVYHEWYPTYIKPDIHHMINEYHRRVNAFVSLTFRETPSITPLESISVCYVNQFQGNRFSNWPSTCDTFVKDNKSFYKARSDPDSFCRSDPFPSAAKLYDIMKLPPLSSSKIEDQTYLQQPTTSTEKLIGNSKFLQPKQSPTRVMIGLFGGGPQPLARAHNPTG